MSPRPRYPQHLPKHRGRRVQLSGAQIAEAVRAWAREQKLAEPKDQIRVQMFCDVNRRTQVAEFSATLIIEEPDGLLEVPNNS